MTGAGGGSEDLAEDLEVMDAPAELITKARAENETEVLDIMPENWPAVRLFAASGTQWRLAGMSGVPTGLDYAGVEAAARMAGIEMTEDLFGRLRVMERAALAEMMSRHR